VICVHAYSFDHLHACLSVSLSICLPACQSVCLPACLSVCLPACLPVSLSACLPACQSVCLPACLSVCLPACLPVSLSAWPSLGDHVSSVLLSAFACLTLLSLAVFLQCYAICFTCWVPLRLAVLHHSSRSSLPPLNLKIYLL